MTEPAMLAVHFFGGPSDGQRHVVHPVRWIDVPVFENGRLACGSYERVGDIALWIGGGRRE